MAIRSKAASPSKQVAQHGSVLAGGVGALHDMSPRSMESLMKHSTKCSLHTQQRTPAQPLHMCNMDTLALAGNCSIQAAAKAGSNAYASRSGPAAISITSCTPSLKAAEPPHKPDALASTSYSSQSPTLARVSVSSAGAVALAATSAANSSLLHQQRAGLLGGGTLPHFNTNSTWKVPYSFSTPVEKKLQQHLETLKRDPDVRKALEARLDGYRAAEAPLKEAREALLEGNKLQAVTLTHDVRLQQVQSGAKQRVERMQQARQQHQQREKEELAAKVAATQRGELIKQQRLEQEAEREAEQRRLWQAKLWAGVMCSTSYLAQLLTAAKNMEQAKLRAGEQQAAVVTIQRFWRGYRARKKYHEQQHCVRLLQQAWRHYICNTAQQDTRRYQAAARCLRFLMEFNGQNSSQLKWAAKRVKRTALRDLRLAKQLDLQRTSQYLLLTQQWTALEIRMIALARRRTGADQLIQGPGTKSMRQSKLVKLTKQKTGVKSLSSSRRVTAADDGDEDDMPATAINTSAAVPDGPSPASGRASDRLLLEDLSPTQLELKARIAHVYLKMKAKAYIAVLGLYWRDKAAWKRTSREQANLAAAKAILHGADEAQQEPGAGEPDMSSSCCPERPRFRATATLRELGVLMQQAVAEAPYLEAVTTRQNLDNYRAKLEQELDLRKQQFVTAVTTAVAVDDADSSIGVLQQQQQQPKATSTTGTDILQLGLGNMGTPIAGRDSIMQPATGAATARWGKERVQACLVRRFALAGCSLTQGLTSIPATKLDDWDDMTLSELLYSSA